MSSYDDVRREANRVRTTMNVLGLKRPGLNRLGLNRLGFSLNR